MSSVASGRPTFVFDTATGALWAEEVAQTAQIPVEVVPAPADAEAKCDLALVTLPRHAEALAAALRRDGVPYRLWTARPAGAQPSGAEGPGAETPGAQPGRDDES